MKIKTIALASALLVSPAAQAKTLTIGIDLSGSNPLLAHENFAYQASHYFVTSFWRPCQKSTHLRDN